MKVLFALQIFRMPEIEFKEMPNVMIPFSIEEKTDEIIQV